MMYFMQLDHQQYKFKYSMYTKSEDYKNEEKI